MVYVKRRSWPSTNPWGTPAERKWYFGSSVRWDSNYSVEPETPSLDRLDRIIWWFTISKVAKRSYKIRNEDWLSVFTDFRISITVSCAVSVEWPLLKPHWFESSRLFWERKSETWVKTAEIALEPWIGKVVQWSLIFLCHSAPEPASLLAYQQGHLNSFAFFF